MLLLTMMQRMGPSADYSLNPVGPETPVTTGQVSFVTWLSLPVAIDRIYAYRDAFNGHFAATASIDFSLHGVFTIEELSPEQVGLIGARLVESLAQTFDEFSARAGGPRPGSRRLR